MIVSVCGPLWAEAEKESSWQLSLGIGAGVRTNPIEHASDIPLVLLPQLYYTKGHFFIDNLDMGLHLHESKKQQINLLITPSYDQIFFDRWNSGNFFVEQYNAFATTGEAALQSPETTDENRNDKVFVRQEYELHDRDMTALGGIEYNLQLLQLNFQLQYLQDLLDKHNGHEIRFSVGHEWQLNRHTINLSGGLVWQDQRTINYYYGVQPGEVAVQDIYQPGASSSSMLRLDWSYRLTENWDMRFFSSYRHLDSEIRQSPIVTDDKILTLFFGGVYHF